MTTLRYHTQIRVYDGGLRLEACRPANSPGTSWTVTRGSGAPLAAGKSPSMYLAMEDGERAVMRLTTKQRMGI